MLGEAFGWSSWIALPDYFPRLTDTVLEPSSDIAVPRTHPAPIDTEAKTAVSTSRRRPRRRLVVSRMCRTMDRGSVMVGVVTAFDERRGSRLS